MEQTRITPLALCGECGERAGITIAYGPLTPRLQARCEAGILHYGGQAGGAVKHNRYCTACGHTWWRPAPRDAALRAKVADLAARYPAHAHHIRQ